MSDWQDSDEVTTTYGSIQLSLQQSHQAGIDTEQKRIIAVVESLPFIWMGDTQLIQISRDEVVKLIKGENK